MDEEEAIPTGDDNSIGTPAPAAQAAAAPQGDSGAVGEQAIPTGDDNSIAEGPVAPPQEQPKRFGPLGRIVSYLMGEGAVPPQVLQQAADQIDPEASMSASDRNLMVVQDAAKRGGPDAAWKMVQANRVAYNAKQAFAYAALNGNQQKPPDLNAAADAANQAADHVLDGSHAKFTPTQGGVTAAVTGPDGKSQQFNLTPDQFRQYLNVGGAGQFDKQMQQGGIARTLTNITQNQQRVSSVANTPPLAGARQQQAPAAAQDQEPEARIGAKIDGFGPAIDSDSEYSPELQKRANRMFPPGSSSNHDREEWMAKQLDQENQMQNKVDIAKETGENRVKAARETGRSRVETQDSKNSGGLAIQDKKNEGFKYSADAKRAAAQIKADSDAAKQGSKEAMARISEARKSLAVKRQTGEKLTPEEVQTETALNQAGQQALQGQRAPQQQPAPQRQAPQQAAPGTPPVQGARFYKGQWYTRGANGEAVPYQQ